MHVQPDATDHPGGRPRAAPRGQHLVRAAPRGQPLVRAAPRGRLLVRAAARGQLLARAAPRGQLRVGSSLRAQLRVGSGEKGVWVAAAERAAARLALWQLLGLCAGGAQARS
eukprot:COSAG02_NODE_336_length_24344_cov_63.239101_4_plen_112_part_00